MRLEIPSAIFFHFHFLSFLSPQLLSPPSLFLLSIFSFSSFFTSKAVIFYTKTVVFISDSMTTISYLRSSPGLHFYIVFLVEKHTKAVIFISKLSECRFVFFVTSDNTKRRWKSTLQLQFLFENSTSTGHFLCFFGLWLNFFVFVSLLKRTKALIFLGSSPSLQFYIVFLVEEHTKAVIFILKLYECRFVFFDSLTTFCLFLYFSQYKSLNFFFSKFSHYKKFKFFLFCFLTSHNTFAIKMEEDTKDVIFIYKKLRFLSQTAFSDVPLFLGFMIFGKTKAFIFLGVLPLFCFLSSHTTKTFSGVPLFLGFMIFGKTKAFIFLGVLPLFCFLSSRTAKNLDFFGVPEPSIICVAFWVYIWIIG
ncbi:hypothetical protein HKD37_14G039841 [Glycine soja]